jgi:transposase-like protein
VVSLRLSDEERLAIVRAYEAGEPTAEIAARFGVDHSYPGLLAKRWGVKLRSPAKSRAAKLRARRCA